MEVHQIRRTDAQCVNDKVSRRVGDGTRTLLLPDNLASIQGPLYSLHRHSNHAPLRLLRYAARPQTRRLQRSPFHPLPYGSDPFAWPLRPRLAQGRGHTGPQHPRRDSSLKHWLCTNSRPCPAPRQDARNSTSSYRICRLGELHTHESDFHTQTKRAEGRGSVRTRVLK